VLSSVKYRVISCMNSKVIKLRYEMFWSFQLFIFISSQIMNCCLRKDFGLFKSPNLICERPCDINNSSFFRLVSNGVFILQLSLYVIYLNETQSSTVVMKVKVMVQAEGWNWITNSFF
jgi:hypothetical protein